MKSELIIDARPKEVSIAVLEDRNLVELHREKKNIAFSVGDIYLGTIKKLMPGLNAAFIDVGHNKEAFLHYNDLGEGFRTAQSFLAAQRKYGRNFSPERVKLEPELEKNGTITDFLKVGDEVVVQITKEAISTKGLRLSVELSFAGRYLVLIPHSDKVSISQKIRNSEERNRLKQLILSIKPSNVTVIVRTSAEGVKVAELDLELRTLIGRWEKTVERLGKQLTPQKGNKKKLTAQQRLLHEESSRTLSILRDTYNSAFKEIWINDEILLQETKEYIEIIDPGKGSIVNYYDGKAPIFDHFDISKQIKFLLGHTVTFKQGAYLVIDQTEAMHVIDVNSGTRSKGSQQQEDTAIDVNLAAAEEIARQLRLRDIGGIIVVDFIDMSASANRKKLHDRMVELMEKDRARHTILPITKFGLMQITRQRVRPALKIETDEVCPSCHGKGKVQPTILFTERLEPLIQSLIDQGIKEFTLQVHPYVAAYITQKSSGGFLGLSKHSLLSDWKKRFTKRLTIQPDQSLGIMDYEFYDSDHNELSHILDENSQEEEEDETLGEVGTN